MTENVLKRLVVVVDDDSATRKALGRLLRAAGFVVALFESAEAFIAAKHAPPMCLIVDVHLPGMSGLDLQVRLRERGIVTPVIVMTALYDVAIGKRAAENGCIAFLRKPFNSQTLFTAMSAVAAVDPTTS